MYILPKTVARDFGPPFFFLIKSTHLGLWFISWLFSDLVSNSWSYLHWRLTPPPCMQQGVRSLCCIICTVGSQISPLHFAPGSQISSLNDAAGSKVKDFCRNLPTAQCSGVPYRPAALCCGEMWLPAASCSEELILPLQKVAGNQILSQPDAVGSQFCSGESNLKTFDDSLGP
jgi:hypothetical protein